MNTPDSQKIIIRFFEALDELKASGRIKSRREFARMYDIDHSNMNKAKKSPERDIFQVAWLTHMVEDFKISAKWLLTGKGKMLR